MEALGIESASFIGNSMGGIVGVNLAIKKPDRVSTLVTIGGVGPNVFTPSLSAGPYWSMMHKMACPTLLTWGRDDRVGPLDMAMVPMRLIPQARAARVPELRPLGDDRGQACL